MLRFNRVGFVTKYYGKEGGLGTYEDRLKKMEKACDKLIQKYPEYGYKKTRKKGMCEVKLKKINVINDKENNKNNKTKNNKTKKNKK